MSGYNEKKFMDMLMEKICEKIAPYNTENDSTETVRVDIDTLIKDISHPTDPGESGFGIEGWGPDYVKNNLLLGLQKEKYIEILPEGIITITQKGKMFCANQNID